MKNRLILSLSMVLLIITAIAAAEFNTSDVSQAIKDVPSLLQEKSWTINLQGENVEHSITIYPTKETIQTSLDYISNVDRVAETMDYLVNDYNKITLATATGKLYDLSTILSQYKRDRQVPELPLEVKIAVDKYLE